MVLADVYISRVLGIEETVTYLRLFGLELCGRQGNIWILCIAAPYVLSARLLDTARLRSTFQPLPRSIFITTKLTLSYDNYELLQAIYLSRR